MTRRRYRRHFKATSPFSKELTSFSFYLQVPTYQADPITDYVPICPPVQAEGKRLVSHCKVMISSPLSTASTPETSCYWALVYVPHGIPSDDFSGLLTLPQPPDVNEPHSTDFFKSNQFVLASGVFSIDRLTSGVTVTSPVKRVLNSGDRIVMVMACTPQTQTISPQIPIYGLVQYFVKYK